MENPDKNFKENMIGGIDCERFIKGEYMPYTMTAEEAQSVNADRVRWLTKDEKSKNKAAADLKNAKIKRLADKMTGIEFNGIMCSATAIDSAGLLAALKWLELGRETSFHFENGNKLKLTQANYQEFANVWMPFRQSFFND